MNFFLFPKLIFKLWKLPKGLIVNFLKVFILNLQYLPLFRLSKPCCVRVRLFWGFFAHLIKYPNVEFYTIFFRIWRHHISFWSTWVVLQFLLEPIELVIAHKNLIFETLSWSGIFHLVIARLIVIFQLNIGSSLTLKTIICISVTFPI